MVDSIDKQKDILREQFIKGDLTPSQYWQERDALDAARQEMLALEEMEYKAKQLEAAIQRAGGVVQKRQYGQIPNPWLDGFKSLTNQMALEKNGDFNLIAILKHEAGQLGGDRRLAMAKAERERLEKQQRLLDETAKLRAVNDARLNRQQPHSDFADKVAESRRKNANVIPYFGG
jgi:hypothetical protein